MLATLLEIVGFLFVVAAAFLISLPLALLVAGVGLIVGAQVLTTDHRDHRDRPSPQEGHRTWIKTASIRKAAS